MKRLIAILLCLCLMLCGCTAQPEKPHDETKLQIVCTSFPAYDFAREIAGDRAELTLLIKPGSEVHSYESENHLYPRRCGGRNGETFGTGKDK